MSLVVAYYVRHKLSKSAFQDLLTLLNVAVPECVPPTKYFVERYFFCPGASNTTVHFYCPKCEEYLCNEKEIDASLCCSSCNDDEILDGSKLKGSGHFFLVNPIRDQLTTFLQNGNLAPLLFENRKPFQPGTKGEITTGDCYQSERVQSFLNESPYNFTMTFNADGVKLHESSPQSLWPILCSINELEYVQKPNYVCMSTLYCNQNKSPREALLKMFVEETRQLRNEGFQWIDVDGGKRVSKVMFLLCVADAPARALLANMTQYNGEFGCGHCFNPGTRARTGRGSMQAYPLAHPIPLDRDEESLIRDADAAVQEGVAVNGVKGPSSVCLIPGFDAAKGFVPDVMHCLFLGLSKQFLNLWKSQRSQGYYVQQLEKLLDAVIVSVHPPDDLPRIVRPVESHGRMWKSNEHKAFLLLYSAVALKNLLPPIYYKHWLLLVNAYLILLQIQVTDQDVETADLLLIKFVFDTEKLYGLKALTYNLHLQTHIVTTVRNWGLPWAYSAFLYEGVGGDLKKLFHGTKHVSKQIFQNFLITGRLRDFSKFYIPQSSPAIKELYARLDHKVKRTASCPNLAAQVLGSGKRYTLRGRHLLSFEIKIAHQLELNCFSFSSFQRFVFENKVYTTARYCESFKRNNSLVQLKSGAIVRIELILDGKRECVCPCNEQADACQLPTSDVFGVENNSVILFGSKLKLKSVSPCKESFVNNMDLVAFLKEIDTNNYFTQRRLGRLVAFFPSEIAFKCIVIPDQSGRTYCVVNKIIFEGS